MSEREEAADVVIVLVPLGRSTTLNGGRGGGGEGVCVCRGAAPPIIKLACCVEGPCLWGRRGSLLHSVDRSEREESRGELSHSGYFSNSSFAALRLATCTQRLTENEPGG